jgi:general secretion pathway protein H
VDSRPARSARGFTLIELMVVLAIVAGAAALVIPAMASVTGANAKKAAGELAGSMRALFDTAAVRHATCRLAIDLDHRAFWAECAPGPAGASPGAERTDDETLAQRFSDESDPEIRKVLAGSTFGEYKDRLIERRELPGKAAFGPVHLEGRRDAQESGTAYVYFFPGGQAQRAWVPVVDGKHLFTVVTEPFTGRSRVVAGKVEVKE